MDRIWGLLLTALLAQRWEIGERHSFGISSWIFTPPAINGSEPRGAVVVLRTPTDLVELYQVVTTLVMIGFDAEQFFYLLERERDKPKE